MTRQVSRTGFRAMGVDVELTGVDVPPGEMEWVSGLARRFAAVWDESFSRFRPDSEVSRVNAAAGRAVRVSPRFVQVLDLAVGGARRSHGKFDPTILPALVAAGYDRDIVAVRARRAQRALPAVPSGGLDAIEQIRVDRERCEVTLPATLRLDFGGIAKGVFVDLVAGMAGRWPGGWVDAGGDLRVWGVPPDGERWVIGVEDPRDTKTNVMLVELAGSSAAGIATSGSNRRRWEIDGQTMHHLIEPRTGQPLSGGAAQVSVFAPSVAAAEIASKSLLVAAARGEHLDPLDAAAAVVVYPDGRAVVVPGSCPDACQTVSTGERAQSRQSA